MGSRSPLLERDDVLRRLHDLLADVRAGRGRAVFLVGEAGIGKTAVASAFADAAAEGGAHVAWARAWDGGDSVPFMPWRRLLDDLSVRHALPRRGAEPSGTARVELFEEVAQRLSEAARRRLLVLAFEDVHLLDDGSATLLRYVTRDVRERPLLVLCTSRDDEVRHGSVVGTSLAAVARDGDVVRLPALTNDSVDRLFAAAAGFPVPPTLAPALHEATQGNPLFVEQIAQHIASGGEMRRPDRSTGLRVPRGIEEVLRSKVDRAGGDRLKMLLSHAAVLGREFDAGVLASVVGEDVDVVLDELAVAVAAGLLAEVSSLGRMRFTQPLLRELLYEQQPPTRRMRAHAAAAAALERLDGERYIGQIADHLFKAGRLAHRGIAVTSTTRAAQAAMAAMAYEDAARYYHRALTLAEAGGADPSALARMRRQLEEADRLRLGEEPSRAAGETALFRREGEYWTVVFGGRTSRFKDSKGLRWLRVLLAAPGREFHVLDLASDNAAGLTPSPSRENMPVTRAGQDEVLDRRARAAYVRRIAELEDDIADADADNDAGRARRLTEERDFVVGELAAATGLGGRSRAFAGESERARVSVTRAVRLAIEKIAQADTALGQHLTTTVTTGTFVSYRPDPRVPIVWTS